MTEAKAEAKKRSPLTAQMERDAVLLAFLRCGDRNERGEVIRELVTALADPAPEPTLEELPWMDAMRSAVRASLASRAGS